MIIDAFFKPESKITHQIIRRINRRRAAAMQQAVTHLPPDADDDSSESEELRLSIIAALEGDAEASVADDWGDRRWLSEIFYHFLGRLARRSQRAGANEFDLDETIVEGMRVRLGLDAPEDASLLQELAKEFSSWLVKCGEAGFVAGWGRIVVDTRDPRKFAFKPLASPASTSYLASHVTAATARQSVAGMKSAARLDRETESSDH